MDGVVVVKLALAAAKGRPNNLDTDPSHEIQLPPPAKDVDDDDYVQHIEVYTCMDPSISTWG